MHELPEFVLNPLLIVTAVLPGLPALLKTCLWFCAECACQAGHCMGAGGFAAGTVGTTSAGSGLSEHEYYDHVATHYAVEAGLEAAGAGPLTPVVAPLTYGPTAIKGYQAVQNSGGVMGAGGAKDLGRPTAAQEIRWMNGF